MFYWFGRITLWGLQIIKRVFCALDSLFVVSAFFYLFFKILFFGSSEIFVWWPNQGEQKVLVESSPYFCIRRQPIWGLWFCYWFFRPAHWKWAGHTNLECSIDRASFFLNPQLSHHTDSRMSHKFRADALWSDRNCACQWARRHNSCVATHRHT